MTLENDTTDNPGPPVRVCDGFYIEKQPLLTTTWGQNGGYNNYMPTKTCTPSYNNGKAYTGCVATAMAQIIRYHEYPSTYNYSVMPNILYYTDTTSLGAGAISLLMLDAAVSLPSTYKCDGTEAAVNNIDIVNSFKNFFNYSSSITKGAFSYSTVKSELNNNRPVLLTAYRNEILFWGINGHAWVTDGYLNYFTCTNPYNNHDGYETLLFHMNWGWNGTDNGWFGYNNWAPGTYNYQYDKEMVIGIMP